MGNSTSTEILPHESKQELTGVSLSHADFKDIIYGNIIYTFANAGVGIGAGAGAGACAGSYGNGIGNVGIPLKDNKGLPPFEENYYKKNKEVIDKYIDANILNNYINLSKFMKFIKCNEKNKDYMDCITEKSIISAIKKNKPLQKQGINQRQTKANKQSPHRSIKETFERSPTNVMGHASGNVDEQEKGRSRASSPAQSSRLAETPPSSPVASVSSITSVDLPQTPECFINGIILDNMNRDQEQEQAQERKQAQEQAQIKPTNLSSKTNPITSKLSDHSTISKKDTSLEPSRNVVRKQRTITRTKTKTKMIEDKINAKIKKLDVDIINEKADDASSDITRQGEYDQESI
jgi:hypothetical protein